MKIIFLVILILINFLVYSQHILENNFIKDEIIIKNRIKEINISFPNGVLTGVVKYDSVSRNIYKYYVFKYHKLNFPKYDDNYKIYLIKRHHFNKENNIDSVIETQYSTDTIINGASEISKYTYDKKITKIECIRISRGKRYHQWTRYGIYDNNKKQTEIVDYGSFLFVNDYYYNESNLLKEVKHDSLISESYYYENGLLSKSSSGHCEEYYYYNNDNKLDNYEIIISSGYIEDPLYPGKRTYKIKYNVKGLISEIVYNYNDKTQIYNFNYSFY